MIVTLNVNVQIISLYTIGTPRLSIEKNNQLD